MQATSGHWIHPVLRELVAEASLALARLDADRLEEMAISCRALNRDLAAMSSDKRGEMRREARDASRDMEAFGRVLDATRSNLEVMKRVQERRRGGLEYPAGRGTGWVPWPQAEKCDGNH